MSSLQEMQNSAREAREKKDGEPTPPQRGVDRAKSGSRGGRRPPGRSKSHKIGRPAFSSELPPEPARGVERATSGRLRSVPGRSRSFGKTGGPERVRSAGAAGLKTFRRQSNLGGDPAVSEHVGDDVSIADSVFTSASNQTMDSIALRKKQFGPGDVKPGGMRMPARSIDSADFDDQSLHTVDSIGLHHRHVQTVANQDQGDMSVWSESFASTGSYDEFSDYEYDEDGVDLQEVEYELDEGISLEDKELPDLDKIQLEVEIDKSANE